MTDDPATGDSPPANPTGDRPPANPTGDRPPTNPTGDRPPTKKRARPRVRLTLHERRWAPAVHAAAIPGILLGLSFVGPLLVGRLRGGGSPFVRHQVVQAANFNLTVGLASLAGFVVILFSAPGEPATGAVAQPQWVPATALSFLILVLVYWFMFTIRAMVSTSYGELYRYPPSLRVWH